MEYSEFLARKAQLAHAGGFEPVVMPGHLFDFQRHLVQWAVEQGRYGIGAELKPTYYEQMVRNLAAVDVENSDEPTLLDALDALPFGGAA